MWWWKGKAEAAGVAGVGAVRSWEDGRVGERRGAERDEVFEVPGSWRQCMGWMGW